jgi:hypothetical protein
MRLIGTKGTTGYRRMKEETERERNTLKKGKRKRDIKIVFKAPFAFNVTLHIARSGSVNCTASMVARLK